MNAKFRMLAPVAVVLLSLAVPAGVVLAASGTDNLAGRPVSGDATTECQGTAYGRVDGKMVLFFAGHCVGGRYGQPINGDDGARIGVFGPDPVPLGLTTHDLVYILLDNGKWPATRNQVFAGTSFWNITSQPGFTLDCAHVSSYLGTIGYQFWQRTSATTTSYRQGTFQSLTGGSDCVMNTNIPLHSVGKDSGSPFILSGQNTTVVGIASIPGPNGIAFSPVQEGLTAWNSYWLNHGTHAGVHLCYSPSCP